MTNTPNYINQMNWISTEPSLLAWQIKTKAHDVKGLEYLCFSILIVSILSLLASIVIYFVPHKNENLPLVLGALGIAGVFAISMCLGDIRRKVWLVYSKRLIVGLQVAKVRKPWKGLGAKPVSWVII